VVLFSRVSFAVADYDNNAERITRHLGNKLLGCLAITVISKAYRMDTWLTKYEIASCEMMSRLCKSGMLRSGVAF
jgi:hypothetical protein